MDYVKPDGRYNLMHELRYALRDYARGIARCWKNLKN